MLRPERMSKVSVTGSKGVMPTVIETIHELNLVHLSDYDGSWEGFDNGNPIEGADDASEKLVTVRALESTLGLSEAEASGQGTLAENWEQRLEEVRTRINELDDQQTEVREELRQVDERIDRVAPFAELGIDLDLLSGYDTVDVLVGEGSEAEVQAALEAAEDIRAYETFTSGDVVAIVAAPTGEIDPVEDAGDADNVIDDALVGIEFTRYDVPDTEQSPSAYVSELEDRKYELESRIDEIDDELERIEREEGSFLLQLEAELTIEVQRAEAPLQFATSDRAFIAEGWVPSDELERLKTALRNAVGDSLEIEELERASYDRHGRTHTDGVHQGTQDAKEGDEPSADADEDDQQQQKAVTDGGSAVTMGDEPPTIQDNPSAAKPFEMLVQAVNRPKYNELDPTIFLFLTFPLFFGFMISDVGYGLLYVLIGFYMYKGFDSPGISSLGGVAIWAGAFTILFGILFGEFFGLHELGYMIFGEGGAPMGDKGLSPATADFVYAWLIVAVALGVMHLNIAWILDFIENIQHGHGLWGAITHSGSWLLMLNGIWIWVFTPQAAGVKPEFIFTAFDGQPFDFGFSGFDMMTVFTVPADIAYLGGFEATFPFLMVIAGIVLLAIGDPVELAEFAMPFAHVVSYARMTAVLLAKGGMAFVVNLLTFGAYETTDGSRPFAAPWNEIPEGSVEMFPGLFHMGDGAVAIAAFAFGVVVLILGHILVLLLGITSAGLQGIRLEYVEFFGKFYDGGGKNYEPFGDDRTRSED
ncbi:A-type ATP synthase subunit I [Natrialba magadii ATCC 43099]|uniref:A-type ATP synthase subunit I n=2 Tax=Natrialba magadii (strain ATCC 43099 / DSM 3394 / CCM 3739 / CIP 104546 / IAM 13178 / JCM 8861 / NBRC 102185 / NCIMB 2190 / MS3) TaxID=547559 RepID=D3ST09_NATMM|nr:A-type ATP synthase subunit I [Natrialba magadii ATCC 43099]